MIKLLVIGNLGKDAVVGNVNGRSVINFTVAHTEKYKDAQGVQVDKTTWVDCAYWSDRIAIAPYLKKGTQVYAEGTPDIRSYTTADGRSGTTLTLRVLNIQLLGTKNAEGGSEGATPSAGGSYSSPQQQSSALSQPSAANITEPADDLPF